MIYRNIKISFVICATLFLASVSGLAIAADGAELYTKKTCNACHGADANTPLLPVYPKLAGQNADYLFNQMKDIKSGARSNGQSAAMKGIMAAVSDDEIRAIADWLSGL
jgi:cytochrome c